MNAPRHPDSPARMPTQGAVIGLGYVGLSLASAFGRFVPTIGFDIDQDRIRELRDGHDRTGETPHEALSGPLLSLTDDPGMLQNADFRIVTVPTPVDLAKRPDLSHLVEASRYEPNQPNQPNKLDQPDQPNQPQYDVVVLAVPHRVFREKEPEAYLALLKGESGPGVLVDVKRALPQAAVVNAGVIY